MKFVIAAGIETAIRCLKRAARNGGHEVTGEAENLYESETCGILYNAFGKAVYEGVVAVMPGGRLRSNRGESGVDSCFHLVSAALVAGKPIVVCSQEEEYYPETLQPLVDTYRSLCTWVLLPKHPRGMDTDDADQVVWLDAIKVLELMVQEQARYQWTPFPDYLVAAYATWQQYDAGTLLTASGERVGRDHPWGSSLRLRYAPVSDRDWGCAGPNPLPVTVEVYGRPNGWFDHPPLLRIGLEGQGYPIVFGWGRRWRAVWISESGPLGGRFETRGNVYIFRWKDPILLADGS